MKLVILLSILLCLYWPGTVAAQGGTWTSYPAALNPADEAFVKAYIDRYRAGLVNLQKDKLVLVRFIEHVLAVKGIPKALKNLAVNESYLQKSAVSVAGAAGPWQFMPETATGYGLRVDATTDERFDIYKSTYAAAKMLKQLYGHFQDWNLVVAAYSCGPALVDNALKRSGGHTFWDIAPYLPAETSNHVRKFIGITHVLDNMELAPWRPESTAQPDHAHLAKNRLTTCYITAGYNLDHIVSRLKLPPEQVTAWNPEFTRKMNEQGGFWLVLPVDKMPEFLLYKNEILEASIQQSAAETATR